MIESRNYISRPKSILVCVKIAIFCKKGIFANIAINKRNNNSNLNTEIIMVRLVRYANCTYFLLLMLIDTRRERISLHLLWKFGPSINTTAQYNKIKHSCTRTHFLSKREFACLYYPICVREYVLLVINSFAAYDRMMYLTLMR